MDGGADEKPEDIDIIDYVKGELENMPPITEALNLQRLGFPISIRECQERLKNNFAKFKGNYIALFLMFLVFFIIFRPYAVLIVLVWALYFFFRKRDAVFYIGSFRVTSRHLLFLSIGATVLLLIFLKRIVFTALSIFSIFTLCVFTHLCIYIDDPVEEV